MGSHTRNALTVKKIATSKEKKLRDGGGLWLVTKGTGRYWVLDYRFGGKRREMGLGPLHSVGLAEARQKAEEARALLRTGVDPIEYKNSVQVIEAAKAKAAEMTFGKYADSYIDEAVKAGRWRGAKTEAGWRNSMTRHAALIRDKAIEEIGVAEVLSVTRGDFVDIFTVPARLEPRYGGNVESVMASRMAVDFRDFKISADDVKKKLQEINATPVSQSVVDLGNDLQSTVDWLVKTQAYFVKMGGDGEAAVSAVGQEIQGLKVEVEGFNNAEPIDKKLLAELNSLIDEFTKTGRGAEALKSKLQEIEQAHPDLSMSMLMVGLEMPRCR